MSSEGFRGVPGVPEGWELVHANRIAEAGEWYLNGRNMPQQAEITSGSTWAIIRKIEQPAKYRPFANGKEVHPFWDVALRLANAAPECRDSWFRITTIGRDGITTNRQFYSYETAFENFCVDDDGTPFGVKIDE
jgi:hypothetical protein